MTKSLDDKIASIHASPASKAFILADAKDADMAFGLASPGTDPATGAPRSLADYRDQIRQIVRQGLVDIMLMSCSTSDQLTLRERLFDGSRVTPAVRANDTTDIHLLAGSNYAAEPSRPFRTALIDHIQAGKLNPTGDERRRGADLGLYSITLNNNIAFDYATIEAYRAFRIEAEEKGFRHFLEIFDPNACGHACPSDVGKFINDAVARTLAGVASAGRPVFLKIPYHGPAAMEALAAYDPHLVPGILGGSSGTTFDAFFLLHDARRHGARAALFGRKINSAEHQLTFVEHLRLLADGLIEPADAVKSYHSAIAKLGLRPARDLAADLQPTATASAYSGSTPSRPPPPQTSAALPAMKYVSPAAKPAAGPSSSASTFAKSVQTPKHSSRSGHIPATTSVNASASGSAALASAFPRLSDGSPDFRKMTSAQKVAYARQRLARDIDRDRQRA